MQPIFISVTEFAHLLGIGRTKAYELLKDVAVDSTQIGRRRLVAFESAQKFAQRSLSQGQV